MSDVLITNLQRRIDELTADNAKLSAEAKDRRIKGKTLAAELDVLKAAHATLQTDFDALKVKADATPGEHAATIKDLQAKLRGREVADKFADAAKELADGVTLDKAFKLAGFDPTSDDAEKADPAELVGKLRASDPYLFKPADATSAAAPGGAQRPALQTQTQTPTGRGGPDTSRRQITYKAADVADYGWQARNPGLLAAIKDGTAQFVE